ncbi:MAG: methyltransferase domain-containing protein, partial [Rhodospirillaceae bacterium]|nr:methyltransferase domain-containing protein [Rhodospirillaceae bacterium]
LLLALLQELPNAFGTGSDISEAAIAVARGNAERNGLAGRCSFVVCNVAAGISGTFDIVVSNPPYIPHGEIARLMPEVRDFDPALALDGGADGLDAYRAILPTLPRCLKPEGRAVFEIGAAQSQAVSALARAAGLVVEAVKPDLAGRDRCVVMRAA